MTNLFVHVAPLARFGPYPSHLSMCASVHFSVPMGFSHCFQVSSAHSREGIAQLLATEGFFVVAPNLLGHAWRRGTDYRVSALAEDLQRYMDTSYDVIIDHSLGGPVALSLLSFLPQTKETTVMILDPVLKLTEKKIKMHKT
ncbi:uncharacterized protein EDB91DRAFT_1099748 [Suillus paluster]|uniref:uncharacterized protein n=1 Tax=Suillus paluster TaxID=48578 RepID=UPI001B85D495|nr:uncharacterized protein EDB91DRAFT_1099748 [Suillus paluster]KAG1753769.1 hypothetical protein EDB91DRAFT_1099748 [Suillus paluster]